MNSYSVNTYQLSVINCQPLLIVGWVEARMLVAKYLLTRTEARRVPVVWMRNVLDQIYRDEDFADLYDNRGLFNLARVEYYSTPTGEIHEGTPTGYCIYKMGFFELYLTESLHQV